MSVRLLLASTASVFVGFGVAQGQPAEPITRVDELVVTTGFRPESLSESAGSTSIIDSVLIEARGAEHLESVLRTAANVTMTSGSSRSRFVQIRGVGDLEQFVDPKHYPSVGLSIDGIDIGGIASAAMLFDVEQIEVLRGPQGTRFGATALAGQINVLSAEPSENFDAYLDAGVGDYGTAMLGLAAGGAISDTLSARVAVQNHRSDGYIENAWLGRDDTNGYDESMLRAKMRWQPNESASFDFTTIFFDSDNGYDAFSLDNTRKTLSDAPGLDDLSLTAFGVRGSFDLSSGGLIDVNLNWLDSDVDYGYDEDWVYEGICDTAACPFGGFSNTDRYRRSRDDVSLDLRWVGERETNDGREQGFVLGLYAQDRSEALARQYFGLFTSDYDVGRVAIYGQYDTELSERLALTVGYRFEQFDDEYADSNAFVSATDDEFRSGEISLRFRASERAMVYGRVARGTKPGSVNTEASSVYDFLEPRFQTFLDPRLVFPDEQLTNFEVGVKSSTPSGRLGYRAALFHMSRDDAQLETWFLQFDPFLWVGLLDSADGDNLGVELEFDMAVTERWRIEGSIGLLDTEVDSMTTFDLDLDQFVDRRDIDQTKSPSWQIYFGSEWTLGNDWTVAADIDSNDSHRYGYYHDGVIERATRVNASVSRQIGTTKLTLWARNLLDEDNYVHGLYFGNDPRTGYVPERYLQFGEPRIVGLTVRHSF